MAPGSQYALDAASSTIVGIVGAARRLGIAEITASGTACVQHVAGAADQVVVQVLVDNAPAPNATQQYSVPASQADGLVCSPFTISTRVAPFLAVSHSVWLAGTATGAPAYVTGGTISVIVHH